MARAEPQRRDQRREEHQQAEDARIRALANMKDHESLYMEFLESLSGKKEAKAYELEREEARVLDLIDKNAKIVFKLVASYFDELKEQWASNMQATSQARLDSNIGLHIKKTRQKLSKLRKISESFVSGNFEEDLLSYALEKNLSESAANIQNLTKEIEASEKNSNSSVSIVLHKEKIQDFFSSLQELVEVNFQGAPEIQKLANNRSPMAEDKPKLESIVKEVRDKSAKLRESAKDEEPRDYSKGFREIKRQPLKQKPINFNDSNLLKPSEAESLEDICLKKYLEPKRKTEEFQQPRQVRQSHNRPPKDSLSPSPAKGALRSFNDRTDSKDFNKENRLDMSKMTSKEIFDLSQNSMNDLLHSDLGVTRLQPPKKGVSNYSPSDQHHKTSFSLHFFQPRSNKLHLIHYRDGSFSKEFMELGEFIVPRYHRSLLTAEGVIILTGGFVDDKPSKRSYLLDIERSLMTEISEMNVGRTGHVLVAHLGLIYAIGGVADDGSTTDTCEVFSPQMNTWNEISRMNHACHSACAVSDGKSIYRFGGKNDDGEVSSVIERFNGEKWLEIKVDLNKFKFYTNSLVFQPSTSELMIVGGTEEEYEQKTRDTFFVKLPDSDRQSVLECRRGPSLPVEEGFWSQEVEQADGKFYMLQNVVHVKDKNSVLLDQRRLLEYSPQHQKWSVIPFN